MALLRRVPVTAERAGVLTAVSRPSTRMPHANRLLVLAVAIVGVANFFWGEILPVRGGFGWDGLIYGAIAREFPDIVLHRGLTAYYVARSAPSAVVHYALAIFDVPLEDRYILTGFRLYNLFVLIASAYLFGAITDVLKFSARQKCLAFVAMFLSFAVARKVFYTPVETDPTAIFLGTLLLFFFLRSSTWGVLAVTLVGAFTWPIMLHYGLLLYLFPRRVSPPRTSRGRPRLGYVIASALVGLAVIGFIRFYFITRRYDYTFSPINHSVVYLSIVIALGYLFWGCKTLLGSLSVAEVREIVRSLDRGRLLMAVALFVGLGQLIAFFGQPNPHHLRATAYLPAHLLMSAIQQPGVFWVAHVVFFGPILLLTLLLWNSISAIIRQYGIGLMLFFLVNVLLSVGAQSRFVIAAFPFVVSFTVEAARGLRLKPMHLAVFCALSLVFSKVWLTINTAPWTEASPLLEFPAQYLFMNVGPWMSPQMYALQGSVVVLTGLLFIAALHTGRRRATGEDGVSQG